MKYYITALLSLALSYYMAFEGDSFSTAMVIMPAFLFFVYGVISALIKAICRRDTVFNLIKFGASLVLAVSLAIPLALSDQGLRELTNKRMQIMGELKPVFLKYCEDKGHFPETLKDLVPEYLDRIPPELINDGQSDSYKKIYYEVGCDGPMFLFKTVRGPDSSASYNVVTGAYWHDT